MNRDKKNFGQWGEDIARDYLTEQGYKVLEKNYCTHFGEIDIIAREGEVLCFIEVRTRTSDWHGHPLESITRQKKMRLIRSAQTYFEEQDCSDCESRFDVVAVIPKDTDGCTIELIKNAFDLDDISI